MTFQQGGPRSAATHAGKHVRTTIDRPLRIDLIDTHTGKVLAEHVLGPSGTRDVSNGHPRGPRRPPLSAMS